MAVSSRDHNSRKSLSQCFYISHCLFMTTIMSFSTIPVLDLSLARNPDTKPTFLETLRDALLDVGFLYIKNTGIDDTLTQHVITQGKAFFDLPEEAKLEIQMKNCASFLGTSAYQSYPTQTDTQYTPSNNFTQS